MTAAVRNPARGAEPGRTRSPFHAEFAPAGEPAAQWHHLTGSSGAIALMSAARKHPGITLVVTRSSRQALILANDLELLRLGTLPILMFPDQETLPYDTFSPHPDITSQRLRTLSALAQTRHGLLLTPVSALANRLPPTGHILQRSFDLNPGDRLDIDAFRSRLLHAGYDSAEQVYQPGQFAIRGSVIDLYPSGYATPIRIDLFDCEIDTIRAFDPESQRSTDKLAGVTLLPAREYPTEPEALDEFRRAFRLRFDVDTRQVPFYQDLRAGVHPQGLEQYLPLFYPQTHCLLDYIKAPIQRVMQSDWAPAATELYRRATERWEQRRYDIERPVLEPDELFLGPDELQARLEIHPLTVWGEDPSGPAGRTVFAVEEPPAVHIHERGKEAATDLKAFLAAFSGQVLFAADSPGRREVLGSTLAAFDIRPQVFDSFEAFHRSGAHLGLAVLPVEHGFVIPAELALLTETQLFGGRTRQNVRTDRAERDPESIIRSLSDLVAAAPVVHEDHGVGRYLGLEILEIDDRPAEFLMLQYAGDDKLYVPVSYLHLVSRYTGADPDTAPLHRLGGQQWEKARR